MAEKMSANKFASHMGVAESAVRRAINEGRITAKKVKGRWEIDPDIAKKEWAASSRFRVEAAAARELQKTEESKPKRDLINARTAREVYDAKLAELRYKRTSNELVPADEVLARWSTIITTTRTKLLAIPSKAKIAMPELKATHIAIIEGLIREALEEICSSYEASTESSDD